MASNDDRGRGLVYKPTAFATNSPCVAEKLNRTCTNRHKHPHNNNLHRHVHLINGRAKAAQVYPVELCQAICEGIVEQKHDDARGTYTIGSIEIGKDRTELINRYKEAKRLEEKCHVVMEDKPTASQVERVNPFKFEGEFKSISNIEDLGQPHKGIKRSNKRSWESKLSRESEPRIIAFDDVTGAPLDAERVRRAREEEIRYFKKMKVYKKVLRSKCHQLTGRDPIGVRWVDVNKQDNENPLYRSRLVAKQFKTGNDPELFAATPPLETMKLIISIAATRNHEGRIDKKIMINDVSRAYFYAPSEKPTFVEICAEDFEPGDEDKCGELQVSMYGTRQAAQNWQSCIINLMEKNGFTSARSSPCMFWHKGRDLVTMVHGDDFFTAGCEEDPKWLKIIVEAAFEIKTKIIGPEAKDDKQAKVLNRTGSYKDQGIEYEADPRHAELIVQELGLQESKE
eukprot:5916416-Karenia_brevis.AAC.1